MQLNSDYFKPEGTIPKRFTGEGEDISPRLTWSDVPKKTREFVLIVDDPDAPKKPGQDSPYVHWVAYNIPANISQLPEGLPDRARILAPAVLDQGENSFGKLGYGGPMPPRGDGTHHYRFTLYALDQEIGLEPGHKKPEVLKAIEGHVLEKAVLVGTYERH